MPGPNSGEHLSFLPVVFAFSSMPRPIGTAATQDDEENLMIFVKEGNPINFAVDYRSVTKDIQRMIKVVQVETGSRRNCMETQR
jgi:hypothetical protein